MRSWPQTNWCQPLKKISKPLQSDLGSEEVITATLIVSQPPQKWSWPLTFLCQPLKKVISVTAEVNLTIKYAITVTLKIISATTKVILASSKLVLVTAEYSDLISNLLPGPFLSRCYAMAECIGNRIMLNIIQQGFLGILMISSLISWCSKELILLLISRPGEHHLFIIMLIAIN